MNESEESPELFGYRMRNGRVVALTFDAVMELDRAVFLLSRGKERAVNVFLL